MKLKTKQYNEQIKEWPGEGKHIMAQYDDETVVVYQAYRPEIANFAISHQYFGGEFKYSRMSWIKPNFLWMMYRCGWGNKQGQEKVLAIYLHRNYFEEILKNAHPSTCPEGAEYEVWKLKVQQTNVRLQWDPDHDPFGVKLSRKAIQLGLRNEFLIPFKGEGINEIVDITQFVSEQYQILLQKGVGALATPQETPYELSHELKLVLGM